jgi:glycosyltransferase involved in cell wall biosynthesis
VLHVAWSGRIGGIERLVQGIAKAATARGGGYVHRVCLLDGRGPVGEELEREDLAVRFGLRTGWDPRLAHFWRVLRMIRPRILHFHTHALGAHIVGRTAIPDAVRVYSEHSPRALRSDRKFAILYRILRETTSAFAIATPGVAELVVGRGIPRSRIVVIPNGVPVQRRIGNPRRSEPPVVGLVARLEPQKRVDLFLAVLAELRSRGTACRGIVVGDGSLRGELVRVAEDLGLRDVVEFVGEQADDVPWLDRLDVFLMTSDYEPFGIAALEAMARRVPVVAMPCPGGLRELVERGGLLLSDRDPATAAESVERVLSLAEERERLRILGDQLAEEYSFDRVVQRLDRLYGELLHEPRAAPLRHQASKA